MLEEFNGERENIYGIGIRVFIIFKNKRGGKIE